MPAFSQSGDHQTIPINEYFIIFIGGNAVFTNGEQFAAHRFETVGKLLPSDILIIPCLENTKINTNAILKDIPELKPYLNFVSFDFKGKQNDLLLFYTPCPDFSRVLFIGMGKDEKDTEAMRNLGGLTRKKLPPLKKARLTIYLNREIAGLNFIQPFMEGFILGGYKYELKSTTPKKTIIPSNFSIFAPHTTIKLLKNYQSVQDICASIMYTRDLVNTPSNKLTPLNLAKEAQKLAKQNPKIKVKILNEKQLAKEKLGAILAVGQGSSHPPCLISLQYKSPKNNTPTIALVGKGVTFDTGGINLKSSSWLLDMKMDMAGAATVLGIFHLLTKKYNLPVNLVGIIGSAENAISHKSAKPSDIIPTMNQAREVLK